MAKFSTLHTTPHEVIVSALEVIQTQGGDDNLVVLIADSTRNYYIQFAGKIGRPTLHGEAVANHDLKPEFQLSNDDIKELQALGWEDRGSGLNYSQSFQATDDQERLAVAEVVWQTFSRVYGIPTGSELEIKVNLQ